MQRGPNSNYMAILSLPQEGGCALNKVSKSPSPPPPVSCSLPLPPASVSHKVVSRLRGLFGHGRPAGPAACSWGSFDGRDANLQVRFGGGGVCVRRAEAVSASQSGGGSFPGAPDWAGVSSGGLHLCHSAFLLPDQISPCTWSFLAPP